jgi:hypothetical protein
MSGPHKNAQETLNSKQLRAIAHLAAGRNDRETASLVGVRRERVTLWRNQNLAFRRELQKRQTEISEQSRERLVMLLDRSLDVLERRLDQGDVRVALALLNRMPKGDSVKITQSVEIPSSVLQHVRVKYSDEAAEALADPVSRERVHGIIRLLEGMTEDVDSIVNLLK